MAGSSDADGVHYYMGMGEFLECTGSHRNLLGTLKHGLNFVDPDNIDLHTKIHLDPGGTKYDLQPLAHSSPESSVFIESSEI